MSLKTTFREQEITQLQTQQRQARAARRFLLAESAGWVRGPMDPAPIVTAFSGLRLLPGFRLVAYAFRGGSARDGVVWALPRGVEDAATSDCPRLEGTPHGTPRPSGAVDPMEAVTGEVVLGHITPWAYLSASFLVRELERYGQPDEGLAWGDTTLLQANPWPKPQRLPPPDFGGSPARPAANLADTDRVWLEDEPAEWRPRVEEDTNRKFVQLFMLCGGDDGWIECHRDRFRSEGLEMIRDTQVLARGPGWSNPS